MTRDGQLLQLLKDKMTHKIEVDELCYLNKNPDVV